MTEHQTPYYNTLSNHPVPISVVQGKEISVQPYGSSLQTDFGERLVASHETERTSRGACRDCIWAVLFYAHIGVLLCCTIVYVPHLFRELAQAQDDGRRKLRIFRNVLVDRTLQQDAEDGDDDMELDIDPIYVMAILGIAFALSLVASSGALGFLMAFAQTLVKVSLFFNIALMLALGVLSLAAGYIESAVLFMLMSALAAYFTCRIWHRIPFAASNLRTAVTAVKCNIGLGVYAYLSVIMIFIWSIWWSFCFLATIYVTNGCTTDGECESEGNGGVVFLFLLSFYWTVQVIGNVVHCTTAGTVGTWWLIPQEANGCCSKAVRESYHRSVTTSFGSICLASLIVAVIQAIRELVHSMRDNSDGLVACCADCLLACIESLVELFNRFALVYVSIHGQSFLEAGRSVMDLFRARGWTTIITDALVDTVLSMIGIGVGLLVGSITAALGAVLTADSEGLVGMAFILGFIVGYACCSTLLSVISSAVNAVIVLYAENPNEFETNHPELSSEMRTSWREAWPNEFSY